MDFTKSIIVLVFSLLGGLMGGQVGGGGLLTLPILLFIGVNPLIALGTNRTSGIFLNLIAASRFYRHKKVAFRHYLFLGLLSFIGGIVGTFIVLFLPIDETLLKKVLIAVLFLIFLLVLFNKEMGLQDGVFHFSRKHYFFIGLSVFIISIYGGMFGVAMTTMFTILFAMNRQSYIQSMSHSLFLSMIVSVISAAIFLFHNQIDYYYAFIQIIGGGVGAFYGSKMALKKGNIWLRNLIFIIIIAILIKLGIEVF